MAKLTILRGVSGSGKTTYALQQNALVVSRDSIRAAFFGSADQDYHNVDKSVLSEREKTVTIVQDSAISAGLSVGKDVVVDNTNTEWKFVKSIAKIGYRHNAEVEIKVFDVPLAEAKRRNKHRALLGGRFVPDAIIEQQHSRLQGTKDRTLDAPVIPEPYSGTPGKPEAFLFDLDGTTYHMGDKRGPYDHNVDVDDPDPVVQEIVSVLALVYTPIAMSGRVEATREKTEFSLNRDGVPYEKLFMRKDGDMRPDNIIKAELFDEFVRDNYDVKFVLDDRQQVVDAWRSMGLKCLQVEPGDF